MNKRRLLFSILAIMIVGLLVVSCTVQRTPGDPNPQRDNRQTRFLPRTSPAPLNDDMRPNATPGQRNQGMNTPGTPGVDNAPGAPGRPRAPETPGANNARPNNTTNQMGNNVQDRAEKLADVAAEQKEVESASCLITGDTAMVGLQFNKQYKGELTDDIKEQVDKKVREADKRIKRVVVTADPDFVSRIEEIFDDIGNGKPLSGFANEINEMINRINPK